MKKKRVTGQFVYDWDDPEVVRGFVNCANGLDADGKPEKNVTSASTHSLLDQICKVNAMVRGGKKDERRRAWLLAERISNQFIKASKITPAISLHHSRWNWELGWATPTPVSPAEFLLRGGILDLAVMGRLSELLKCDCGQYFLARVETQRYHSAKCREKAFKSTPEWKEYRNEKAREYYRLNRDKNVK